MFNEGVYIQIQKQIKKIQTKYQDLQQNAIVPQLITFLYEWQVEVCKIYQSENFEKIEAFRGKIEQQEKEIDGKEEEILDFEADLKKNEGFLEEFEADFKVFDGKVYELEEEKETLTNRNLNIQDLIQTMEGQLELWQKQIEIQQNNIEFLQGDSFLAAFQLIFFGEIKEITVQEQLLKQLKEEKLEENQVKYDKNYRFSEFLTDKLTLMTWKMYELPKDEKCYQNAIIISQNRLKPFILDP